jgi:SAM-dependent methyltransferase
MKSPTGIQQEYYAKTAGEYDTSHCGKHDVDSEHDFALLFLSSLIDQYNVKRILDVGSGTGRALQFLMQRHPNVEIIGIEPVEELREQGYKKGISRTTLIDGDGCNIKFPDKSFDLACEFGVLHHVPKPELMVSEMLRVAKRMIFISDNNNFGQGSALGRFVKHTLNAFGLWRTYDLLATKGKGYHISEGDGLFYSYSVFNNYDLIKNSCDRIHLLNTANTSRNFYKSATHVALLGFKK